MVEVPDAGNFMLLGLLLCEISPVCGLPCQVGVLGKTDSSLFLFILM